MWQAIRDGVIEATINHAQGYMQSKQMVDVYSTGEPLAAFHKRISFCLDIHNKSVKVSNKLFSKLYIYVIMFCGG